MTRLVINIDGLQNKQTNCVCSLWSARKPPRKARCSVRILDQDDLKKSHLFVPGLPPIGHRDGNLAWV